ncbi:MAG: hypothetical protein KatS3mg057_3084 [Herpetosiphonaceae bacterium]|nr:MAG: hypothetical protein KatS3mg057_3084 [Herpetosiphonaceae bacterium]
MNDSERLYTACLDEGSDAQIDAFESLWRYLYCLAFNMLHSQPGGDALAADCTQLALIKIHRSLGQCQDPKRFRSWAAQILRRTVIDELRRPDHARRADMPGDDHHTLRVLSAETLVEINDLQALLRAAIASAALSDRSRRVIVGRYFNEQSDHILAQAESQYSGKTVLPSQIQVTRAKNLVKLRSDTSLMARLRELIDT